MDHADADDERVARAHDLADDVLFPVAQVVDRSSIPSTHFDDLRDAGLFSLVDLTASTARRVMAAIAGGCGATFFVWVQHHGVVRTIAGSPSVALRADLLPSLLDGSIVAGTAFAHVRRIGSTAVRATRVDGNWHFDGRAPWATSWGIADRFAIAATTDDDRLVWAVLPGDGRPGVSAHPLQLPVFSSTGTVAIDFDGVTVTDADVVDVQPVDEWRATDRIRASIGAPAVLGVADRAIRLLRGAGRGPHDPAAAAADRLAAELADRWRIDDELTTLLSEGVDRSGPERLAEFLLDASRHRTACLDIGRRTTTALLAAVGGSGMDLSHPAQRLEREAAFYVIQAQTRDGRAATLDSV